MAPSSAPAAPPRVGLPLRAYACEAVGLGLFMFAACVGVALLEHPASLLRMAIDDALARRALMGVMMGIVAIGILESPLAVSGAHINPAVTLAQLRLGRIATRDALFYGLAQLVGGAGGVGVAYALLGEILAVPSTRFCVTVPGDAGEGVAFAAEAVMSFAMAMVALSLSSSRHRRFTSIAVGLLVALYITLEAPLSGMSINPARTLASAVFAHDYRGLWLYLTAPPLGMLLAAEVHERLHWRRAISETARRPNGRAAPTAPSR